MKCIMEIKQVAFNSITPLLEFRKKVYEQSKYTSQKIIDFKSFNTINIPCNVISDVKANGKDTDILYAFILTEPRNYLIIIIQTNILYQNVTRDRLEYFEFHIKDEHGRSIDFNGDLLSFTLRSI